MTRGSLAIRWGGVAIIIVIFVIYFIFDPSESGFAPKCMLHALTGFECPGCGSQRMLHALLHGDLAAAWRYNAFLLLMMPVFAVMLAASATRTRFPKFYAAVNSPVAIIIISLALVGWTIFRNFYPTI